MVGEHIIDTQDLPPSHTSPNNLSFLEKVEVNWQIHVLVKLGKMRAMSSKYAYKVTLPIKKDGRMHFCCEYLPLNTQTCRDAYPMPLIDNVLSQMGFIEWFTFLDLQNGFWQ